MMLDCKHAARLLSQSMDRELPLGQRVRLRLHLLICDACSNFGRQLRLLRKGVGAIFR